MSHACIAINIIMGMTFHHYILLLYSIGWKQVTGPSHTQGEQVIQIMNMRTALGSVCHNTSVFFSPLSNVNNNNLPFAKLSLN